MLTNKKKTFTVTDGHIKLLERSTIRWEDHSYDGAPAVDTKRPYGNSDVPNDIMEILEWKVERCPHCDGLLGNHEEMEASAMRIHREMETVFQILTANPTSFGTGTWIETGYKTWQRQ